jgi:peptide/nickel transport system substrate-binding protein
MALEAGEIDLVQRGLGRADALDMEDDPNIDVQVAIGMGATNVFAMNYNEEFAPLNDVRVRRAIAFALFPQEIIDKVLFGTAELTHSPVHSYMKYGRDIFYDEFRKYSPEERIAKGKELLAEAGYPDGFKTEYWYTGGEEPKSIAAIVKAQLAEIGIDVDIQPVESGIVSDLRSQAKRPRYINGWQPDYSDPDTDLFYVMSSASRYMNQRIAYNNPKADELINLGKALYEATGDPPERAQVYHDIQDLIIEDMVGVWMYHDSLFGAQRAWVKGYQTWQTKPYTRPYWDASKEIPDDWETTEPPV